MSEEEETGFVFIDKRNQQPEPAAPDTEPPAPEIAEDTASAATESSDDGDEQVSDGPGIYGLLTYTLGLFASEAWQNLGLVANQATGEAKQDLPAAKVAIDVVGDLVARLESAPGPALDDKMKRELKNLVNDLRLNYVAQREHAKQG